MALKKAKKKKQKGIREIKKNQLLKKSSFEVTDFEIKSLESAKMNILLVSNEPLFNMMLRNFRIFAAGLEYRTI